MHARLIKLSNLLQNEKITSTEQLAEKLEVSRRTAWEDIAHLRSLDHDIEYVRNRGWIYRNPPPEQSLSADVLFALLVAHKAMMPYRGTPFEKPLLETFDRFRGCDVPMWSCSWEALSQAITFKSTGTCDSDMVVYRHVVEAIAKSVELQIDYKGLKDTFPKQRVVRPYHLCCSDQTWYLIAGSKGSENFRTFAITRISRAKVLSSTFHRPPAGKIKSMLDQSVGIFFESPAQKVEISFRPEIARWIKERDWHESQTTEDLEDGFVLLTMTVGITPELEQWILSFGELCEVRTPQELVVRIRDRLSKATHSYRSLKIKRTHH